jgi:hypothetical protein
MTERPPPPPPPPPPPQEPWMRLGLITTKRDGELLHLL